ncbi:hypothetical protein [Citricoccus sp. K5]|uniref:hypothetical protein n=1 Tax=Citricoccus sp. K5 TaxID=2653135 RepID=UPI0012F3DA5E|nr:hypothetical protein [Citricoccus sp. K5]VXB69541.1 conserved exported hypothetical protein [Citricoccus sp. K5]
MERTFSGQARALAVGASVALLALAGCSTPSPQENVSQACAATETFSTSLEEFRATLTPDATTEQLRSARDKVGESYDALVEEAGDVAEDRREELDTTVRDFREAVNEVPDDTKVPDALSSLREEANDVGTALSDVESDLQC